jgi:hypothetical protein
MLIIFNTAILLTITILNIIFGNLYKKENNPTSTIVSNTILSINLLFYVAYLFYVGFGLSALPLSMIRYNITVRERIDEIETNSSEDFERLRLLSSKYILTGKKMPYNERKEYIRLEKLRDTVVINKKNILKEYSIFNSKLFQFTRIFFGIFKLIKKGTIILIVK